MAAASDWSRLYRSSRHSKPLFRGLGTNGTCIDVRFLGFAFHVAPILGTVVVLGDYGLTLSRSCPLDTADPNFAEQPEHTWAFLVGNGRSDDHFCRSLASGFSVFWEGTLKFVRTAVHITSPQTWNRYAFVINNLVCPISRIRFAKHDVLQIHSWRSRH
jgi:hypothetical protein